jgi:hypothetical protein
VSLLEILRVYASTFHFITNVLGYIEDKLYDIIKEIPSDPDKYNKFKASTRQHLLSIITRNCEELELTSSLRLIKYIIDNLENINAVDLKANIVTLQEIINDELNELPLLYMPRDRLKWFDFGKEDIFGEIVSKAFKNAIPDIKYAGNCYVIGLNTACVFHLMRVVEYALRALARERKVTLPQGKPLEYATWHRIITEISDKANEIDKKAIAGPEKDEALSFYRGLVGEFSAFKDVYRNHVMHTRIIYQGYEAEKIIIKVKEFMERLSKHISENRTVPISWKLKYNP